MNSATDQITIGILHPGELGSAFGNLLLTNGFRVVCTLEGRSTRTKRLCRDAGLSVLHSLTQVLDCSDIVFSFVPPGAALGLAESVVRSLKGTSPRFLYVDANSISPVTVSKISDVLLLEHVDFVDASIRGLASQFKQAGVLYLSGARAVEISDRFKSIMRVKVVGNEPGQASALKMALSGLPKGLICLFLETIMFARAMGLLEETMEVYNEFYPGVMEVVERMLPTYPQHAMRRSEELRELEETMLLSGLTPRVLSAAFEVTSILARSDWPRDAEARQRGLAEIIEHVYQDRMLHATRAQDAVARL